MFYKDCYKDRIKTSFNWYSASCWYSALL